MTDPAPQPLKVEQGGAGICEGAEGDTLQLVCSGVRKLLPIDQGCPYIGMDCWNNSSSRDVAGTIRHPGRSKSSIGECIRLGRPNTGRRLPMVVTQPEKKAVQVADIKQYGAIDAGGLAALTICESLLISLTENGILRDDEASFVLEDAASAHRSAIGGRHSAIPHEAAARLIERLLAQSNTGSGGVPPGLVDVARGRAMDRGAEQG